MMFSSSITNNSTATSPFQPYFPFSSSNYHHHHHPPPPPPPPPCVNHETGDIFLHPHLHDPLSGQFSLHNNICSIAPPAQTMSTTHLGIISSNSFSPNISADHHHHHQYYHNHSYGNFNSGDNIPYFFHSKEEDVVVPATKKDRHSKIFTAQGLRDRRVRLSINVARQFFDLQDLLGFDKASKTLDWLLTKSRKAIKQLGPKTQHLTCSSELFKSLSSASECDDVVPDINEVDQVMSKDEEMTMTMMRKLKESESGVDALVARVSRAKARARARERTREKSMCNSSKRAQILNHHQPNCETSRSSTSKGNIGNHHVNQELGSLLGHQVPHHHHHHDQEDDQPVQSVIKTNLLKQSSSVYDSIYNQEKYLNVISAESSAHHQSSSNHSIQFPINASQNWDINGAFPGPSINCSITNINLSTGI